MHKVRLIVAATLGVCLVAVTSYLVLGATLHPAHSYRVQTSGRPILRLVPAWRLALDGTTLSAPPAHPSGIISASDAARLAEHHLTIETLRELVLAEVQQVVGGPTRLAWVATAYPKGGIYPGPFLGQPGGSVPLYLPPMTGYTLEFLDARTGKDLGGGVYNRPVSMTALARASRNWDVRAFRHHVIRTRAELKARLRHDTAAGLNREDWAGQRKQLMRYAASRRAHDQFVPQNVTARLRTLKRLLRQ